jgi:hypothetical protein
MCEGSDIKPRFELVVAGNVLLVQLEQHGVHALTGSLAMMFAAVSNRDTPRSCRARTMQRALGLLAFGRG